MLWNRQKVQFPWPESPAHLLQTSPAWDYVIIGSGAAGSSLAGTLARAQPSARILVLEAGVSNVNPLVQQFSNAMKLRGTIYDWNDKSQPQTCMDSQPVAYDAGRCSGGSTSINGMVWVHGSPTDYDGWAALGNPGWDYQSVLPIFKSQEMFPGGDPAYRGLSGPVYVSTYFTNNNFAQQFLGSMVSYGIPQNADYNGATQQGVAYSQLNVSLEQIRQDAFSTMLAPVLSISNVAFVNQAQVTSIGFTNGRATSVSGWVVLAIFPAPVVVPFQINVTTEVILCAGALRSPQLLMLSGIGPAAQLQAHGIPVVADLPGVGQNLQDQTVAAVVNPLTQPDPNHVSPMDVNVFTGTSASGGPQFEVQSFYMLDSPGFPPNMYALGAIVLRPASRGSITLQDASAFSRPLIQPALLCDPGDMQQQLAGLKMVREMMRYFASATGLVGPEYLPGPGVTTDQQLMQYIRDSAVPDFHFIGTCKMGPSSDPMAVVDSALRVYGVQGLRVADASIMPFVTSGNTNAPSMMIGGKCAQLILSGS